MPEVQEVFHMATQKVRPDPNALERQHRDQRKHAVRQKATVFVLVGAVVVGAAVFGISVLRSDDTGIPTGSDPVPLAPSIPQAGQLEPGTYAFETNFDVVYQVTIDIPEGYRGIGFGVLKNGHNEMSVSASVVGGVFADVCDGDSLVEGSTVATADGVTAVLAAQRHMRVSEPVDATLDGYAGTYMERTLPRSNADRCQTTKYDMWQDTGGGLRWVTQLGQRDFVWVLDVDGYTLVIDASIDADGTAEDRAEVEEMVGSIQIEPL